MVIEIIALHRNLIKVSGGCRMSWCQTRHDQNTWNIPTATRLLSQTNSPSQWTTVMSSTVSPIALIEYKYKYMHLTWRWHRVDQSKKSNPNATVQKSSIDYNEYKLFPEIIVCGFSCGINSRNSSQTIPHLPTISTYNTYCEFFEI